MLFQPKKYGRDTIREFTVALPMASGLSGDTQLYCREGFVLLEKVTTGSCCLSSIPENFAAINIMIMRW